MTIQTQHTQNTKSFSNPPGRIKIANAVRDLLVEKDFSSITTAEISRQSGVNEALIYRYFGDKRGLLYGVLSEHLEIFFAHITLDMKGIKGALDKLKKLIWSTIYFYDHDRIFARILLLEVRSHLDYFKSDTYRSVKKYTHLIVEIIKGGMESGEIRDDISPAHIRQIILGSIEHLIIPAIIHGGPIQVDTLQKELCDTLFKGIAQS